MSTIEKLSIQGIRSFGSNSEDVQVRTAFMENKCKKYKMCVLLRCIQAAAFHNFV